MNSNQELSSHLKSWRNAEDKFYGSVMADPELYMAGINLVRGIASSLNHITNVTDLLEALSQITISHVADVADELDINLRDFLDYHLAREAAFYLRYQEILEAQAKTKIQANIVEAQASGETWVTLYKVEQSRRGGPLFQQLEMHLTDGVGIYSGIELDWEKGRVYVVEPMMLNPETGQPQREIPAPDPRQEFSRREEMVAAVVALREKYSALATEKSGDGEIISG